MHTHRVCHVLRMHLSYNIYSSSKSNRSRGKPLTKKLEIIDASDKVMNIIGTIRMYITNRVLGGRKLVVASVVESDKERDSH